MGLSAVLRELASRVLLERARRLPDLIGGEPVARGQRGTGCLAACILDVGSGAHCVSGDPLDDGAELFAQKLCGIVDNGIVCGEVEEIADLDICAVLLDLRFNVALREGLSARGHALNEAAHCALGVEKVPAAEVYILAVSARDGSLLAEFGVNEPGLCALQKLPVIKLHREFRALCCAGSGVNIDICHSCSFLFFFFVCLSCVYGLGLSRRSRSDPDPAAVHARLL